MGSCAGRFLALGRDSGQLRWEYDVRADGQQRSFHGAPLLTDDTVVVATDNGFRQPGIGHVYAFERANGRLQWKYRSESGIPSDVVQVGRHIYAITMADTLLCLDLATGHEQWTFSTGVEEPDVHAVAAVTTAAGRVFFAGRDETVYTLDAQTGKVRWKQSLGNQLTTSPTLVGNDLWVGSAAPELHRLRPSDGTVLGGLALPAAPQRVPACTEHVLVVFLGNDRLAAIDTHRTRILWTQSTSGQWHQSRPFIWKGSVLAGDTEGRLLAFSIKDGTPQTLQTFLDADIRSVGGTDDVLYVGTQRGMLYAWRPSP